MVPIDSTIILLLKVVLAFLILYIFLPSRLTVFDEYGDDWTDKFMISLTHSNFIIIILVHFLVLIRIYDTISLFIAIVILIYFLIYFRHKKSAAVKRRSVLTYLLDFMDEGLDASGEKRKAITASLKRIPAKMKNGLIHFFVHPFDGIFLFLTFAFAAAVRFSHSFDHLFYGASDAYVHLAWTKYLGINQIYRDGVYPYGYEAIISALQKLFFIDPATVIRFIGAIGSLIMIFTIYYILRKNLKNKYIIIFVGVAAYVFGTALPNQSSDIWRQLSALPQEYAAIFILLGLHFLNVFLTTNRKKYLILAAEALALTILIHFYAAAFLIVGYVILLLLNYKKVFKADTFKNLLMYLGGAGVIGVLPILIALGAGMKLHQLSLGFVTGTTSLGGATGSTTVNTTLDLKQEIFKYVETNQPIRLAILCAIIMVVFAIILFFFRRSQEYSDKIKLFLTVAALSAFAYTQVRAGDIGFPSIIEASRATTLFGIAAVTLYAMTIYLIEFFPIHKVVKYVVEVVAGICVLLIVMNLNFFTMFNPQNYKVIVPVGAMLEYDQAAYTYYQVKKDFPILNWTIVSPVEQYQESMGFGWHYNLWQFVKDTQIDHKSDVTFPTDYVFVIVEKKPLNQATPYTLTPMVTLEDADKPFPEVGNSLEKYYTVYDNRRIIEAKAYFWMEENLKNNSNFTVYSEDDIIKVYKLQQDGMHPVNLAQ